MREPARKVGILGGTFDPVHHAHLALARAALEALSLDEVRFIPTGTPRYREAARAAPGHRVAMLRAALRDEPRFTVDERELAPGASGYTADTLAALRAELGEETELWFLMGADQYAALDTWSRPDEVRRLARLAVFRRPGVALEPSGREAPGRLRIIELAPLPHAASALRGRAARGEDLTGDVPEAVAGYIRQHRLYR